MMHSFGALDYVFFIGLFVVSIGIGIFFGVRDRGHQNNEEYLMGGRKLGIIPVTLSLIVSFVSTNTLLGSPAELYGHGFMYLFVMISVFFATVLAAAFFVPVFYPLKLTSINEYLERRFLSKSVRYLGCMLFLLNSALYVGTVIFGPATTLETATGMPPWSAIVLVGIIGTAYTTVGGMKAVVWTDAFQSIVMVAGLIAVCVMGASKVGGISEVFKITKDWGRFEPETVLLNWPGFTVLNSLALLTGIVAFAFYANRGCDPVRAEYVSNSNQIVPYFVLEVLNYPGLPGIFISSLFSAALSTLSSSINSMAAVTWEDIFKDRLSHISPQRQAFFTKVMVVIYGTSCIGVSFLVLSIGGNLVQISSSFTGATMGPTLGIFILGALFPWANWKGALVGGITGITFSLWILMGQIFAKIGRETLPSPVHNCLNFTSIENSTLATTTLTDYWRNTTLPVEEDPQDLLRALYSVAFSWFSLLGTLLVISIGLIVSLLTGGNDTENMDSSLLFSCLRSRYGKSKIPEEEWVYSNDLPIKYETKTNEEIGCVSKVTVT